MKDASGMISRTCYARKKKNLLLISLAFDHREEKIEQEKGKGVNRKNISPKDFFFMVCHFLGLASPHNVFPCVLKI
jgi:hypothetical protein